MRGPLPGRRFVAVALAVGALAVTAGLGAAVPVEGGETTAPADRTPPNETVDVVVTFEDRRTRATAAIGGVGGRVTGGEHVDVAPVLFATVPAPAVPALEDTPGVVSVERDSAVRTVGTTPDAVAVPAALTESSQRQRVNPESGSLVSLAGETTWGYDRIDAGAARSAVGADAQSNVDVAVLDTGVDTDHPQLTAALAWGVNTTGATTEYGLPTAEDRNGHGTFTTGVVAAAEDGTTPVGVAPGVDVYAVKVLDGDTGTLSDLVEGIDAAMKGPDRSLGTADDPEVVSISLGGASDSAALQEAVESASRRAVVVAAAGNSGDGDTSTDEVVYPARYDGAVAVAATDRNDETPTFSSEGPDVELAAPGVDVTSTVPGGTATGSGTSFATPFVAGTAALVFGQDLADGSAELSASDVRTRLQNTALDIEAGGRDRRSGYGLIQADSAVGADGGDGGDSGDGGDGGDGGSDDGSGSDGDDTGTLRVGVDAPSDGAGVSGTVEVVADVVDPDAGRPTVEVSVDGGPWRAMTADGAQYVYDWDTTAVADGDHTLTVRAREDGATATDRVTVTVDNDGPPTVSVVEPAAGALIEGEVEVVVSAADDETATERLTVEVSLADGPWRETTYEPDRGFVATLPVEKPPGNYTLRARATDGDDQATGAGVTVRVDENDPPELTLVEPRPNETLVGTLSVTVGAVDDRTETAEIEASYRVDGGEWRPLEYDAARDLFVGERTAYRLADGHHTLSVRASDGNRTSVTNTSVAVNNAALETDNLTVTAGDVAAARGENVTLTPRLELGRDLDYLQAYVTGLPDDWTVVGVESDGGRWIADSRSWFWFGGLSAGETFEPSLTVQVPENATEPVNVTVVAVTPNGRAAGARSTVTPGDETLSVVAAIAGEDGEVQAGEVLTAISYFNSGEPVPGTGGKRITPDQVLQVITAYNSQPD